MNNSKLHLEENDKVALWLKDLFNSEVKPELEALSKEIKAEKKKVAYIGAGLLVGLIIFSVFGVLYFGWHIDEVGGVAWVGIIGVFAIMAILHTGHIDRIKMHERVRESAIQPIFKEFFPGLHYEPKNGISKEEVQRYGVFKAVDQFGSEDRITGEVEGHAVVMSEVSMIWNKTLSKRSNKSSGLVLIADSGLRDDITVNIYPARTNAHIVRHGEKVDLESNEFEARFDVRGDQYQSREVLTPWHMAELLKLSDKAANGEVLVIFTQGKIFLFLSTKNNLFKTAVFGKSFKHDLLEQYIKDAMLFYKILQLVHISSHVKTAASDRIGKEYFEQHLAAENK